MISGVKSAELKLVRAAKHLRTIKDCITAYSASKPHKIVLKAERKRKVNIPKPPPREICILIGEMVYQMRSALDHLAFDLVKCNRAGTPLPSRWDRDCEFPLRASVPKDANGVPYTLPAPHGAFSKFLPNISAEAFAFIESVQPYYGNTAVSNCLHYLAILSNIDKHRYLNIIRPRTQKTETVWYNSGLKSRSKQMLDRGAQFKTMSGWRDSDRAVYVHRRYRTGVSFQERAVLGDFADPPVEFLLKLILDAIKRDIVPHMKKLIQKP